MTYRDTTMTAVRWQPWDFTDPTWLGTDIKGFTIEALDGEIGKVHEATFETGSSYLVVDTGPWIFGRKVMLPAGVVSGIDLPNHRVFVSRTKDQIKNAPEFDEALARDTAYRERLASYYGESGSGWHQPEKSF